MGAYKNYTGSNTENNYIRPDTRVKIAPKSDGENAVQSVVRISLVMLERYAPLEEKATAVLHELAAKKFPQRENK